LDQQLLSATATGPHEAAVEAISQEHREPDWLRALRRAAFEVFLATPMPTLRDEEWRRTDLRGLRLEKVLPFAPPPPRVASLDELEPAARAAIDVGAQTGGTLVQRDTGNVYAALADNLRAKGVIYTDLETAAREHADLVRQYLGRLTGADYSKFSALNLALWTGGVFLYVPRRVEVALPLQALTYLAAPALGSFTRTLVVAEPDSDVTLIDQFVSPDQGEQQVATNVQEIFVGNGARVRYVNLQEWGRHVWNFGINRAHLGRDASLNSLAIAFGGRLHKANVESLLRGPGATAEMLGVLFGNDRQFFDHHTLQDHGAPHTTSDLLYNGALTDRARSVFSGMIHARPEGQKTDAIQTNRNLLLSDESRADSIPNLEIEANDLRCTHAATVAPVDPEQLFYLEARGLSPVDAKRAIVEGFFEPVIERIPLERIVDRLRNTIATKMGA
jgi:Fe-S cluster assembly protein SufD